MCIMRNFLSIWLFMAILLAVFSDVSGDKSNINRKISCKVVPLKARPIIKADAIFSGTVLEFIKKPNVELNFARRRRRRRRKIGKGKLNIL